MRLAIGRTNLIKPKYEDHRAEAQHVILSIFTYYFALHFKPPVYDKYITKGRGYLIIQFTKPKEVLA